MSRTASCAALRRCTRSSRRTSTCIGAATPQSKCAVAAVLLHCAHLRPSAPICAHLPCRALHVLPCRALHVLPCRVLHLPSCLGASCWPRVHRHAPSQSLGAASPVGSGGTAGLHAAFACACDARLLRPTVRTPQCTAHHNRCRPTRISISFGRSARLCATASPSALRCTAHGCDSDTVGNVQVKPSNTQIPPLGLGEPQTM